ncbi:MAG: class A beta-lactamase-related serine hydrolase [Elusimicrobiota bacterium]|nr:class A beta-lactamase-related serine hydrolase [Elusimicrobiota bacterium]
MKKIFSLLVFVFSNLAVLIGGAVKLNSIKQKKLLYNKLYNEIRKTILEFDGEVGIYVKDIKTGVSVGFNEDKYFPSASIVKIPIMVCVFQAVEDRNLKFNDQLLLKRAYKSSGAGKLKYFHAGRKFSVRELVELMITESDNTATNMLADALGFNYINWLLEKKYKLNVTKMNRNVMDLKLRRRGIENYTTAKEIGLILEKIYRGKLVSKDASKEMLNVLLRQKINDRIPRYLPQEFSVAHKTGLLRGICHDAGIVFADKTDFIVCVLTSDFKSTKLAKRFIAEVAYKTYKCYE